MKGIPVCLIAVLLSGCASLSSYERSQIIRDAPAWVMVGITLLALFAAWRTLGILRSQTDIAKTNADSAKASAEAVLRAERAYVSMSHLPPGLLAEPAVDGVHTVRVSVAIENKGNTPARVLNAELFAHSTANPLPDDPPYNPPTDPPDTAYLVKDERFHMNSAFPFPEDRWAQIQNGKCTLWLLGYVDYADVFNRRHRAGSGR